jgi:integrase
LGGQISSASSGLLPSALTSGLRLHDLRHTWASIRLHERAELREVQEQLGHATPGFTLAVYGHLQPGDRKESMDRFSAALARARKESSGRE